jgi:hypothetical protein
MTTILFFSISLASLWILAFKLFRNLEIDEFRQKVFALRDEMFDFASDGRISFDHPAYGQLRLLMNGVVRYGHRMSLFRIWMLIVFVKMPTNRSAFSIEFEKNINSLDEFTRDKLNGFHDQLMRIIVSHLIKQSPLFSPSIVAAYIPFISAYFANRILSRLMPKLTRYTKVLESEAYEEGAELAAA